MEPDERTLVQPRADISTRKSERHRHSVLPAPFEDDSIPFRQHPLRHSTKAADVAPFVWIDTGIVEAESKARAFGCQKSELALDGRDITPGVGDDRQLRLISALI